MIAVKKGSRVHRLGSRVVELARLTDDGPGSPSISLVRLLADRGEQGQKKPAPNEPEN